MDVLVTGFVGIRGTAILAREREEELLHKLPKWLISQAQEFDRDIQYRFENNELLELAIAASEGAVYAEEFTEYGIFEALYRMSLELKAGLEINLRDIPIMQETVEVCEILKVNPYELYSGVAALIAVEDGNMLLNKLNEAGIPVSLIGHTTDNNDKLLINEDERSFLPHVRKDELKRILGKRAYREV